MLGFLEREASLCRSSVAVWTARVNRGGVFPPALADQLVEPVAEVLDLAGAQDTPHAHQLGGVGVVAPSGRRVGVATTSGGPPLGLRARRASRPRQSRDGDRFSQVTGGQGVPGETKQLVWGGVEGWWRAGGCGAGRVRLYLRGEALLPLSQDMELFEEVQPVSL